MFNLLIALRARSQKRKGNTQPLILSSGIVQTALEPNGTILVTGELWTAQSASGETIPALVDVTVVGVQFPTLQVVKTFCG